MSRSFGDFAGKPLDPSSGQRSYQVGIAPDITLIDAASVKYLALMCDGVTESIKRDDEIARFVVAHPRARDLMVEAYKKGSTDNITVIVVDMPEFIANVVSGGLSASGGVDAAPAGGAGAEAPDSIAVSADPLAAGETAEGGGEPVAEADYEARQAAAIAALPQPAASTLVKFLREELIPSAGDRYRSVAIPERFISPHELFDLMSAIALAGGNGWGEYNGGRRLLSDVQHYLNAGGNPDIRDTAAIGKKRTLLMRAAFAGSLTIVKDLITKGADPSLRDEDGKTALDLAKARNRTDVVRYLESLASPA